MPVVSPDELIRIDNGMVGRVSGRALPDVLGAIRLADHERAYAGLSVWWTIGGEGYEPLALATPHMPDPFLFTQMLTGRFAFGFA
jgi:type VI secretion system protein ImpM